jgi:hypothetical protein
MMALPPTNNHRNTRYSCCLSTGHYQARIRPMDWPVFAPKIQSYNVPIDRSPRSAHPRFAANRARQSLPSKLFKPSAADKSP